MCAGLEGEERELVRCLKSVTVLTIEDSHLYPGLNFTEEMDITRMKDNYQLLMEVHDGDEDVIIAAREKNGKISDLIVVVGGEENTLVHVRGRMESDLLEAAGKSIRGERASGHSQALNLRESPCSCKSFSPLKIL